MDRFFGSDLLRCAEPLFASSRCAIFGFLDAASGRVAKQPHPSVRQRALLLDLNSDVAECECCRRINHANMRWLSVSAAIKGGRRGRSQEKIAPREVPPNTPSCADSTT